MSDVIPFPQRPEPEPVEVGNAQPWHHSRSDLVMLLRYLVTDGADVEELIDVVEKPWKYDDEFAEAAREHAQIQASMRRHPAGSQLPT